MTDPMTDIDWLIAIAVNARNVADARADHESQTVLEAATRRLNYQLTTA